jgi:hypothetical protein
VATKLDRLGRNVMGAGLDDHLETPPGLLHAAERGTPLDRRSSRP